GAGRGRGDDAAGSVGRRVPVRLQPVVRGRRTGAVAALPTAAAAEAFGRGPQVAALDRGDGGRADGDLVHRRHALAGADSVGRLLPDLRRGGGVGVHGRLVQP